MIQGQQRGRLCAAILVGGCTVLISGCATELTFRRREALDAFIGKDRATVVAQLGNPTQDGVQAGRELLIYDDNGLRWNPGEPGTRTGDNIPIGPWVEKTHCSTTFRLSDGHVDAWRLQGNDCRDPSYPNLGGAAEQAMARAADVGVNQVANYQHNAFTGRSIVDQGTFQKH